MGGKFWPVNMHGIKEEAHCKKVTVSEVQ